MLTWRSGGSVQFDSIFLLKPPKLSFPLLFSLGLIIIMFYLLALLRFSLIKLKVMNFSARLICKAPKSAHITHLRFPIYNIALICLNFFSGTAPPFLSELLHLYCPSRSLHTYSLTIVLFAWFLVFNRCTVVSVV